MNTEARLVVLTSCDSLTDAVRRGLGSQVSFRFAESEEALSRLIGRTTQLVVIHLASALGDGGIAGRLVRAHHPIRLCPIVGIGSTETCALIHLSPQHVLDDLLCLDAERWQTLLLAWAAYPESARSRVEALRVLHQVAPPDLLPILDELMMAPVSTLSVKGWSAARGRSRTTVFRQMSALGVKPSDLVDIARCLHAVGPILSANQREPWQPRRWSELRTERRVLARTLAVDLADVARLGMRDAAEARREIAARLCVFFEALGARQRDTSPTSSGSAYAGGGAAVVERAHRPCRSVIPVRLGFTDAPEGPCTIPA